LILVVRDENYLNILNQICFSLFVPEWQPFAQSPLLGGEQQKNEIINLYNGQQQKQNSNNNLNLSELNTKSLNSGHVETKWILLHTPGLFLLKGWGIFFCIFFLN
jgi:cell division septal protein FtsQ